jgi:hypothetical protein
MKLNQHFGETCFLFLQSRRISQATNQHEEYGKESVSSLSKHYVVLQLRMLHNHHC